MAIYDRTLGMVRDGVFRLADELGLNVSALVAKSTLSRATVTRFREGTTYYVRFKTVVELCDAVGMDLVLVPRKRRRKVA